MKEILVFAHNYLVNDWFDIVQDQLNLLLSKGLYDASHKIYYCAYSSDLFQIYKFIDLIKKLDTKNKINIIVHPYNDGEKNTIILLQEICKSYENAFVLYYHAKGVTSIVHCDRVRRNIKSWREMLNYFNIEKWESCILALNNHDIYGVMRGQFSFPDTSELKTIYPGNFWWARSSHINKLPNVKQLNNHSDLESLITSIPHSWANVDISYAGNIYERYFDPQEYRKE
jgi:hypothetical protein